MAIIADAMRTYLNTKQKESQSLQDYTRRFKTSKEIMESHIGGPIILSKYIELTEEYKNDVQSHLNDFKNEIIASQEPKSFETKCLRKTASKFYAYAYLDNSDKSKYKSILKISTNRILLKIINIQKNITEANNILNNHKFDRCYTKSKQTQRS